MAVAAPLPAPLAVGQVDRGEESVVETVRMPRVDDEVVVIGLEPLRGPAVLGRPTGRPVGNRNAAHADAAGHPGSAADQQVALRRE